ncbi:MAG: hypothetical protein ACI9G1_000081 [Pirellulaceae bacterium]|jgi:hypothetical protein
MDDLLSFFSQVLFQLRLMWLRDIERAEARWQPKPAE